MADYKEYWEDIEALESAKRYLESVRKEFADEPDLLGIYEPSATKMVNCNKYIVTEYYKMVGE